MAKPWLNSVMGLVTGLVIASSGMSSAATATPTYYACLKSGSISLVGTKAPTCPKGSIRISWNSVGPAGKPGVQGPKGADGSDAPSRAPQVGDGFDVLETVGGKASLVQKGAKKYVVMEDGEMVVESDFNIAEVVEKGTQASGDGALGSWARGRFTDSTCSGNRFGFLMTPVQYQGFAKPTSEYRVGQVWRVDSTIYRLEATSFNRALKYELFEPGEVNYWDVTHPGAIENVPPLTKRVCQLLPATLTDYLNVLELRGSFAANPELRNLVISSYETEQNLLFGSISMQQSSPLEEPGRIRW